HLRPEPVMKPHSRSVTILASMAALVLAAKTGAQAQSNVAGICRQNLLAVMVMIDADEHDKSHYHSTAKSMVEGCGLPAGKTAASPVPFDKDTCGKLAIAMLETIEGTKLDDPRFLKARDEFANKCVGR